jgi:H+/Cl- antiporter ClcA
LASWSLAFAYFISVAYYLNLFGEFGVSLMPLNDDFHAKALTSTVLLLLLLLLLLVLVLGWTQGVRRWNRWSRFRSG